MSMQQNTFSVIFYLRRYKLGKDGKTPIYARITVNGKRSDIAVKRSIEEAVETPSRGWPRAVRQKLSN